MRIRLQNVTHLYGRSDESAPVVALRDLSLEIAAGEFAILTGPSGSGKSTLLHLVGAVDRPSSGRVWLEDREISVLPERELTLLRRHSIGFVFQFFNLIPTLSVAENVAFPLLLANRLQRDVDDRVQEVLGRVGLSHRASHFPNEISGGEMQRAAIARAIAHRPPLLLADEPTGNLDSRNGDAILELIRDIHRQEHPTVVIATHSDHAASFGETRIQLIDGHIHPELPGA